MEANDGSMGFDFEGEFVVIKPKHSIKYLFEDQREVLVEFIEFEYGVRLVETFDAEDQNSAQQPRSGWLAILNNFKRHVERKNN